MKFCYYFTIMDKTEHLLYPLTQHNTYTNTYLPMWAFVFLNHIRYILHAAYRAHQRRMVIIFHANSQRDVYGANDTSVVAAKQNLSRVNKFLN